MTWFDEARLEHPGALASVDPRLRHLAESGARVRRDAGEVAEAVGPAAASLTAQSRPRAVVAAGPDSRLLRAVLEPACPVPFVAWTGPALPGWTGALDLVVVLAPRGDDAGTAAAVAEAVRRGCQVVVAGPPGSMVAEHAAGRDTTVLGCRTGDQLAAAVVVLDFLHRAGLGPESEPETVAGALDDVARACSPHRDLTVNPAKALAIALADTTPLLWGGSTLALRAARRVAESMRRTSGRAALAGDAEALLPVLRAARPRDLFADPLADGADGAGDVRPALVVLDERREDDEDPVAHEQRELLVATAEERRLRVERLHSDAPGDVARYASLLLSGTYASEYLALGLVEG